MARWKWQPRKDGFEDLECVCTNCGEHAPFDEEHRVDLTSYCPHCGEQIVDQIMPPTTKGSEEYAKY